MSTEPLPNFEMPNASTHIRKAQNGNQESLGWIFDYFTPLLELHATQKIGIYLRKTVDPRDLISDAWLVVLPRLSEIEPRDGHLAPVLMKFLASTITNKATNLMRRSCQTDAQLRTDDPADEHLVAAERDVVDHVVRSERENEMRRVIARLSSGERDLLAYRIIEDQPIKLIAMRLDESPNTIAQRCRRLLLRLREMLPDNIFDEWTLDE